MITKPVMLIGLLYDNPHVLFRAEWLCEALKLNSYDCIKNAVWRLRNAGADIKTTIKDGITYYSYK